MSLLALVPYGCSQTSNGGGPRPQLALGAINCLSYVLQRVCAVSACGSFGGRLREGAAVYLARSRHHTSPPQRSL